MNIPPGLIPDKSEGNVYFGGARMALLDIESGFWSIRSQMDGLIGTHMTSSILQQSGANGGASFARSLGAAKDTKEKARFFEVCLKAYQAAGFGAFETQEAHWPIGRIIIRARETFEAWMMLQHDQKVERPACAYTAGVLVGFINIIAKRGDVVCIEHRCQAMGDEECEFELLPAADAVDQAVVVFSPDPKLGRQVNLLETLFERMPMGIAILDRQYHFQRYNPTWGDFAKRYKPPSGKPLSPGVGYFEHLPGSEPLVLPLFERASAGEIVRENSVRLESGGITTYWDIVLAPLIENQETIGILNVAVDVTEQVQLRQNLEQRVKESTRELQMLLDVASTANSSLALDETIEKTLDLVVTMVGAARAGVLLVDERSGDLSPFKLRPERIVTPEDMAQMVAACRSVLESSQNVYIPPDPAQGLHEPGALLPLQIRERTLGVLGIIGPARGEFTPAQIALFQSIADQLSVAIENARLFAKAEEVAVTAERNRLARDLHDAVTQTLFSASMIADVLPKIWERDPQEGSRRLEELRQLTRGALSEMRTLLVELRPAALADTDLADLIGHQVNAFIARTRLPVVYQRQCTYNPPTEIKEAFYRIAQEAFNNIAKHANAESVQVSLACQESSAELVIQDDGLGFYPGASHTDGMGMGIMAERARNVGALLDIQSQVKGGTRLCVSWQADQSSIETSVKAEK